MKVLRFSVLLLLSACAAEPATEVTISTLDFGVVKEAGDYTGELRVTNVGEHSAQLARIEQRGGTGGIFVITPDIHLEPGESTVWRVRLQVREPGLKQVDLAAVFNGSETLFPVRAFLGEPCEPASFDVGETRVGTSAAYAFEVSNPFTYSAELDLGSAPAPFTVEPAGRIHLAAGEKRSVTVTYAPTSTGLTEASWTFASRTDCLASASTLRGRGVTRELVFSPGRLNAGALTMERDFTVQLRNESQRPVRVLGASFPSSVVTFETPFPFDVPAGGEVSVVLRARPLASGEEVFSELTLTTDSLLFPNVSFPVLINRTTPCVTASRSSIDFPSTENLCRSSGELLELANECPHAVTIADVQIPEGFALKMGRKGVSVAPGARVGFELLFAPRTSGAQSARFGVETDVLDGFEHVDVAVSGTATPEQFREEVYLTPRPQYDVLFVLDDGPQMLPLAGSVATELKMYAGLMEVMDTRIGIMTTSTAPMEIGRLRPVGGAEWLERPTPEALATLGAVTGQQASRSSCLDAVNAAISDSSSGLRRMLRPGARLHLVCVTNRADEFSGVLGTVLASLENQLPQSTTLGVAAQFGSTPACGGSVDDGTLQRWLERSRFPSQLPADVCSPRWGDWLSPLPYYFGWRTNFYLSEPADVLRAPLRVTVNGVPQAEGVDWQWDAERGSVNFEPLSVPGFGDELRIRYLPSCAR